MQHSQKFLGRIFVYQYSIPKASFYKNQTKQNNIDFGFLKEKIYVGLFIAKGRNRICFQQYCPTKHISVLLISILSLQRCS